MRRDPAGLPCREWVRLFLACILCLLSGTVLAAQGPVGRSILPGRRMTKWAQETLGVKPDSRCTLFKLFGKIEVTHRVHAPDGQVTVHYFNSSKYPKWTAITGTEKGRPDLLFLELRPRIYPRSASLECGDLEAWVPLNEKRILIWALYYSEAFILDLAVTQDQGQYTGINELFVNFHLGSPRSAEILSPLRALQMASGSGEWDLLYHGRRLVMGRSPYYWWK